MLKRGFIYLFIILPLVAGIASVQSCKKKTGGKAFRFAGGPSGGTFQYYTGAITTLSREIKEIKVLASSSAGSIENIRLIDSGKAQFAIAYSGHVYAGRNGMLKDDKKKYENVLALAYLYGAPAQLLVDKKLGISRAEQLKGKRVGIGNVGSGAAANAVIFFTEIGILKDIKAKNLGYRSAGTAMRNGQLDAFWVFAGFPNASVHETALQKDVVLLNVYDDAKEAGLFNKYPYFEKVTIPAHTYRGQRKNILSFQDAALWVANRDVPADIIYRLLEIVFSEKGIKQMVDNHKSAKGMSIKSGIKGVVTPLHPGAEKFWTEKGIKK
jgi:TRAP transporter TAXI family solute receptor